VRRPPPFLAPLRGLSDTASRSAEVRVSGRMVTGGTVLAILLAILWLRASTLWVFHLF
jgi:hypothetical protein